jgi:hypothetical protein
MNPTRRRSAPGGGRSDHNHEHSTARESSPRLDEDALFLLTEASRFWNAGERALLGALLLGDIDDLVAAAEHTLRMSVRAWRFVSLAVHVDLGAVA